MKILFIAEKPDVSRQLRAIYAPDAKYTSVSKYVGYYESKSYIFTAASGHLFTLKEPEDLNEAWKKWDLAALPMELPRQWPLKPNDKGGRYDPATFATIKKLCARRRRRCNGRYGKAEDGSSGTDAERAAHRSS